MRKISLSTPKEFSFDLCFSFLKRSPREVLHRIEEESVVKAIYVNNEIVVFRIGHRENELTVEFLTEKPSLKIKQKVFAYVREWFDLETDLKPFYSLAKKDDLLKGLVTKYFGYRIIGQPDLFESIIWAVLGQQINLQFAYTLKQRFVELFGESVEIQNQKYFLFPSPEVVAQITPDQLLALQFSRQKASYTIGIAQVFAAGKLSKERLIGLPLKEAKEELIKIKGIGNWTANYALMKTFRHPDAFPLEDAGVHNAIKKLMDLKSKPSLDRVRKIYKKYKGWEAYATLYLWKSL
ncbi:MAG: DNA-3-methyladenine glycosylase [Bacteroidota bacterium]